MSEAYAPGGYVRPVDQPSYQRFRHPMFRKTTDQLDPRWEWNEVSTFSQPGPMYIRGRCNHLEVVPVESVDGDVVAHLCTTCDQQLPEEWRP